MSFENDKLNRKKYADFLTEIITNSGKYKRISDSNAMSIAIDSGWGTGKTTFVEMWKDELEHLVDENGNEKFAVIKYNAWKNDFAEEPLESLIYTIINHEIFNKENEIKSGIQAGKDLVKYAGKIISGIVKLGVKTAVGQEFADTAGEAVESLLENGTEGVKEIFKDVNEKDPAYKNFYSQYENYYEVISKIKESLINVASERKIIIIIDELDRYKPLFAIKLLENIKHILDAKNVCFVFALDMEQLSHSIKCIYGQGMDANGYLCRFFDYISKMPKPDKRIYIQYLLETRPLIRNELIKNDKGNITSVNFLDIYSDFSENINLSLRDIETIYSNFLLLENNQLKHTTCYAAYTLYLFLLILKYKKIELYNKIFLTMDENVCSDLSLSKYTSSKIFSIDVLTVIMGFGKIKESKFFVRNRIVNFYAKIIQVNNKQFRFRENNGPQEILTYEDYISLSDCIFYDDLLKWENIKEKTILNYIQENLEFFDFENTLISAEE